MSAIVTKTDKPATIIPVTVFHDSYGTVEIEIVIPTEDDEAAVRFATDILEGNVELQEAN